MSLENYQEVMADLQKRRLPAAVKVAVRAMLDKKAEDVTVLKLKGVSVMTDYLVIGHGHSTRQNQAICTAVQTEVLREERHKPLGVEGVTQGEWILIDYVDFIINVFTQESRRHYELEKLWMDAKRYHFYVNS